MKYWIKNKINNILDDREEWLLIGLLLIAWATTVVLILVIAVR
jgi:hypothetical protein